MSAFWFKSATLLALGASGMFLLNRSKKRDYRLLSVGWFLALVYFLWLSVAVASAFEFQAFSMVFVAPEIVGAILCLVGLGHYFFGFRRSEESNQSPQTRPTSGPV